MDASGIGFIDQLVLQGFFRGTIVAATLIILCTFVHFYTFTALNKVLKKIEKKHHLKQTLVLLFALFFAHSIQVWLFAGGYMILVNGFEIGHFVTESGDMYHAGFVDALYYSIVTYTSLGFGDIIPTHAVRLLTGIEALLGLLMIAWSASFTYISMEKRWRN